MRPHQLPDSGTSALNEGDLSDEAIWSHSLRWAHNERDATEKLSHKEASWPLSSEQLNEVNCRTTPIG